MSYFYALPKNRTLFSRFILPALLTLGLALINAAAAHAQVNNQPWGFATQNRASIAALMKQTDDQNKNRTATTVAAPGSYDQLVCGGDGESSARANATCIIMNNSDGVIHIGQDANGNQSATNGTNTANSNDDTDSPLTTALESISDSAGEN